jgi:hypothetical protein
MTIGETAKASLVSDDGLKSRKFIMASVSLVAPWATATFAWLVLGKLEAAQWVSFNMYLIPLALGIYGVLNVADTFVKSRAA